MLIRNDIHQTVVAALEVAVMDVECAASSNERESHACNLNRDKRAATLNCSATKAGH